MKSIKIQLAALMVVAVAASSALTGCRSARHAAQPQQPSVVQTVEQARWRNVYLPVKVEMLEPKPFAMSGRGMLVRGESVYISLRLLGMELGTLYATPSEGWLTLKQPQKLAVQMPLTELLSMADVDFATAQEALLGDEEALKRLPKRVEATADVNESRSIVTLRTSRGGKNISLRLTWTLSSAEWDIAQPKRWTAPGNDYKIMTAEQAVKMLERL